MWTPLNERREGLEKGPGRGECIMHHYAVRADTAICPEVGTTQPTCARSYLGHAIRKLTGVKCRVGRPKR